MLASIPLFADLTAESQRLISEHGVVKTYPKNTILINEGDRSDSLYAILSGKVKVFAGDENGKEVILSIQEAGEYFGELSLLDDSPRSASVMTLETSQMCVISKADFQRCLIENPSLAMELLRTMAQRVRALTENVKSLALLDVYGRVARTLLGLAEEQEGRQVITQRLTHQDIANMVGASREMVSRIMKDLSTGGYILLEDRKIVIPGKLPRNW
ncbi:MAG: Crp/Fnr family transcriptional regulator [Candidatus Competibacteraceae bacterium]|nr:Crp/Fnr family transcriptional regulator [Candidatus Competibacteraceae bacterium]